MMGDIIYCPRCQNVVVKNEDLGHCLSCMFSFCTKCSEKWHQGDLCFFEKEEEDTEDNEEGEEEEILVLTEKEIKRAEIKKAKELRMSFQLIKARTRQCHKCKSPIEKNGGCNKVTCAICNNAMCWSCGKDITKESYGHFATNPRCAAINLEEPIVNTPFRRPTPQQIQEIDEAILAGGENAERNVKRCPRCRQRNLRGENCNNHLKCWNCKTSFCFLCSNILTPPYTKHFTKTLCKQHTKINVKRS